MLSDFAKGVLYCLCIMEQCGELEKATLGAVCEFCHILTDEDLVALKELKDGGFIYYKEGKGGYSKFKVLEKGFEENKLYSSCAGGV